MKIKLFFLLFVLFHFSFSQWSTSPYADSGLYVCPGFDPGIVTFDDGSSIVLGMLSSYIYAQKLDPAGYKVWPEPVLVHHNDSSDMVIGDNSERTWFCSDGDGGVILFWQDYRGAYYATDGPKNSTTHLQRVDKYGDIKWGTDGITVNNLQDGYKRARITSDGNDGCVLLISEEGFDYPGAPNKGFLKIARYNTDGTRLWYTVLDSSTQRAKFQLYEINKAGWYYFNFYNGSNVTKMINENGEINSYIQLQDSKFIVTKEQNVFFLDYTIFPDYYKVTKADSNADTIWTKTLDLSNFCKENGGGLVPDHQGGVYLVHVCNDSIIYFDSAGNVSYREFKKISFGNYSFADGINGLLITNTMTARRYDNTGKMVWPDSVVYLYDASNAYSKYFTPDNNGGFIVVYWSVLGGIYVQHTGRNGRLGIVTKVQDITRNGPASFELYQNYPNPFNSLTKIKFSIKSKGSVRISIIDILGRRLIDVVNNEIDAGIYQYQWDASKYASGIYFYSMYINEQLVSTKKLLLTK